MKFDKHKVIKYVGIISLMLLVSLIISHFFNVRKTNSIVLEKEQLQNVLDEKMQTYTNKEGDLVARIGVLESSKTAYLLQLKTKDSTVLRLQKVVKIYEDVIEEYGSSVTVFTSETNVSGTSTNTQVTRDDEHPIYKNDFNFGGWVMGTSIAYKDSTQYDFKIKNEYSVVFGYEEQGFLGLGKSKAFADVTSYNPYSVIKTVRSYRVTEPPKQLELSFGPQFGAGLTSELRPTTYIGFGATLTLFKIKI